MFFFFFLLPVPQVPDPSFWAAYEVRLKAADSTDVEAAPTFSAHLSAGEMSDVNKAIKEQGEVLFAMHNDLCQHQRSVNQAFASLIQACRALVATIVAHQSTGRHSLEGDTTLTTDTSATSAAATAATSSSSPPSLPLYSNTRQFAQLLRQVEALHRFLFTNLYVHQRECALQLLVGVERAVLDAESTTLTTSTRKTESNTQIEEEEKHDGVRREWDASRDVAGQAELRSVIEQLRYRLSSPPHSHLESRVVLPVEAPPFANTTSENNQHGNTTAITPAGFSTTSSTSLAVMAASGDSAGAASSLSTLSPPMPAASAASRRRLPRLFGLSSTFNVPGSRDGPRSLVAVLRVVQRRFRLHGVVLSGDGGGATTAELRPQEEMQLAMQLGCVCLVVPHAYRKLFPVSSSIPITSDRDVLAYDQSRGTPSESFQSPQKQQQRHERRRDEAAMRDVAGWTEEAEPESTAMTSAPSTMPPQPPPTARPYYRDSEEEEEGDLMERGGADDERASALERLFLALEADLPLSLSSTVATDFTTPWPAVADSSGGVFANHAEVVGSPVMQRAALKREGRPLMHREKRPRHDTWAHHSSSSAATAVAETSPPAVEETLMEPFRRFTETAVQPESADDAGAPLDVSLTSPYMAESQHVGITQHGPLHLSGNSPAVSARQRDAAGDESVPPSPPLRPVFQISNSVKYLKPQLIEAIEQLGGVVDLSSGYSRDCRFLVVAEGITERTEKYLGACAAAAYIVPPRYVFDSQRRGYWLENRVQDYNMSPQRWAAHQPRPAPIFHGWRVVLITCRSAAAKGVQAALLAGGCTHATAFVVDLTAEVPLSVAARTHVFDESEAVEGVVEGVCPSSVIAATTLSSATHILVECSNVTAQGCFQLPDWVPPCVRRPEYASRIFTLELLYFCLCAHPERVFDSAGLLCDEEALTPACRVEPM